MDLATATSVSERSAATSSDNKSSPASNTRWDAAAGKRESSVSLAELPARVDFPADCPEPIRFDAAHKKLFYRGQMYHTNYMYLRSLSNDAAYGHAIDELFAASVPRETSEASKVPWLLIMVGAVVSIGVIGVAVVWMM